MAVIELPDEQAEALKPKAAAEGLSLEAWLNKLAAPEEPVEKPMQTAAEIILARMRNISPEIMATSPRMARASTTITSTASLKRVTALFAGTFYWIALADFKDSAHWRAVEIATVQAGSGIVTTDEVVTEYLAFFSTAHAQFRREAAESVEMILASPIIRVIPQSRDSFLAGLRLYSSRPDKGYSLVDCISMQTMRQEGLTEALTNDRHFEQEGFRALFRDS